jgi:hypothetical protein
MGDLWTDEAVDAWWSSLSDDDIALLEASITDADLAEALFDGIDTEALLRAYSTMGAPTEFAFGGMVGNKLTTFLREKAEDQLRDDAGRWRKMMARIAHRVTRGRIGKGLPLEDHGIEAWGSDDPKAAIKERAARAAQAVHDAAIRNEPAVSKVLRGMEERLGGRLAGFEHRVKNLDSTFRKFVTKSNKTAPENYAFPDALRYTMLFEPKQYMAKTDETLKALEDQGMKVVEKSNMWAPDNTYKGINVKMQAPDGTLFEVQFHTPDSFRTKDRNHLLYETARRDDATEEDEAEALWRMHDSWRSVETPPEWDKDERSEYEARPPSNDEGPVERPESVPDPEESPVEAFTTEYRKRLKEAYAANLKYYKKVRDEFQEAGKSEMAQAVSEEFWDTPMSDWLSEPGWPVPKRIEDLIDRLLKVDQ